MGQISHKVTSGRSTALVHVYNLALGYRYEADLVQLIEIQTIAHHKLVGNVEPQIIDLDIRPPGDQACSATCRSAPADVLIQNTQQVIERMTGINDILHNQNVPTLDGNVRCSYPYDAVVLVLRTLYVAISHRYL